MTSRCVTGIEKLVIGGVALVLFSGGLLMSGCLDKGAANVVPEIRLVHDDIVAGEPLVLSKSDSLEVQAWARSDTGEGLCEFWLELFEYWDQDETDDGDIFTIEYSGEMHWLIDYCEEDEDLETIAITTLYYEELTDGRYYINSSEGCYFQLGYDEEEEPILSEWSETCSFTVE